MIQANDVVFHRPSGEVWLVCGVNMDGTKLIAFGSTFPREISVSDCEIFRKRRSGQTQQQAEMLLRAHMMMYIEREDTLKTDELRAMIDRQKAQLARLMDLLRQERSARMLATTQLQQIKEATGCK